MTPLIAKAAAHALTASEKKLMWFDHSAAFEVGTKLDPDYTVLMDPLPFETIAVAVEQERTEVKGAFCVMATHSEVDEKLKKAYPNVEKMTVFSGFTVFEGKKVLPLPDFFALIDLGLEEELNYKLYIFLPEGEVRTDKKEKVVSSMLNLIADFLNTVRKIGIKGSVSTPNKSNKKRIRQGKKPLFEWTTVTIEPRSAKNESLGGTHASPRQHDVRGHWVVRNGNKFWRRPHKRGDASKGVIFHDYVVKPAGERREAC